MPTAFWRRTSKRRWADVRVGTPRFVCKTPPCLSLAPPRKGLGEYAGRTLFGHIAMAVGLDGVALGVVGLSPWARGNDTVRQRRLRGEKIPHGADGWPNEQDRWMSTVAQTEESL